MRNLSAFALMLLIISGLLGCSGRASDIGSPFTGLSWDSSYEDMTAAEGDGYESYDSIYHGLTYTYPKEYLGYSGIIKYMFDAEGKLCNVSWSYAGDTPEEVLTVYRSVCDDTEKVRGPGTADDGIGNFCTTWPEETGTIMANAVITNDTRVMQIAYMSAEVSKYGKN
ncbi:MAG: hypothetical protein K6G58_06775 [Lachnospiraceae bacterium]|nr:hypothetical protein [Lachnospiraceae bacterium]